MHTSRSGFGLLVPMLGLLFLTALVALTLLGPALSGGGGGRPITVAQPKTVNAVVAPHWLPTERVVLPADWRVSVHATKHEGEALDAEKIYALLLEGKCAGEAQYCNNKGKQLILCFDPVTGLLGGIFVSATGLVESGWGVSTFSHWGDQVRGFDAPYRPEFCPGGW